jgi:hypothetical protein
MDKMYQPIRLMDENSPVLWWNECRKIANGAFEAYNQCILEEFPERKAFLKFGQAYLNLKDESLDYSDYFDIMAAYFQEKEYDISFYKGWE